MALQRFRTRLRGIVAVLASLLAVVAVTPMAAVANSPNGGAVLATDLVELGVNAEGHLNWYDADSVPSWSGVEIVGLRYVGHDVPFEATADGCTCEGWGVADAISGIWGGADDSAGIFDVELESFTTTADSAVSVVLVPDAEAPVFRVTHAFAPSANPYAFGVDVTIENVSDDTVDVRYLRSMDWDTQPTQFREVVTVIKGTAPVEWMSDNPFALPNPLSPRGNILEPNVGDEWIDSGPADHGGVFSFDLGELGVGEDLSFEIFYGAAPDRVTALATAVDLDFEAYSIGVPNTQTGVDNVPQQPDTALGVPVTYFFGFSGVGGEVVVPVGLPQAPSVSATVTDDTTTLTWEAPADGGSPLTGYVVQVWDGSEWIPHATVDAATTSTLLESLAGGEHQARVAATNANGQGPWRSVSFLVDDGQDAEEPPTEEPPTEEPPTPPTLDEAEFVDIDGTIFEREVAWMAERRLTKGCNPPSNDRFCPTSYVTRGEIATFLDRLFVLPPTDEDFFTDDGDSIFEASLNRTAAANMFRGCNPPGNDAVCPDNTVTRGELAAVIARSFGLDYPTGNAFADASEHPFAREIGALNDTGITKGCNPPANDRFCPDEPVTRGESAAFLHRAFGLDN